VLYVDRAGQTARSEVACGWCWSCQKNRVNDLVARCLCEAATSDWVRVLTLTYRPSSKPVPPELVAIGQLPTRSLQERVIQKDDFQAFMKRLRHSVKTRYLVAGEYGARGTRRVHFHAVLFGTGEVPQWYLRKNIHINEWPYGHVYVDDNVSERDIRYTAKYLLKGVKRKKEDRDNKFNKEWISYSRIPIMGIDFIHAHADRYVQEKVFPYSFKFHPPMGAENREYQWQGEARYVFLDRIFEQWPDAWRRPKSEAMERAVLRYVKEKQKREFEALSIAEQKEALDMVQRPRSILRDKETVRYGRMLLKEYWNGKAARQWETWEQFAENRPDLFAWVRQYFKRDIVANPPTIGEVYDTHAQRFGLSDGQREAKDALPLSKGSD
jgi:hypothetical protein